jgi:para-nitrobenzyl esterase
VDVIVETGSGKLRGTKADGILVFRGIPYARPPVGTLRLAAPERPVPWGGVRDAVEPGAAAPQVVSPFLRALGMGNERTDEDCLALNVWTPGLDGTPRPVLVWIHGGSFTGGSATEAVYDGSRLARLGNAVIVTVQYRLGALGFLDLSRVGTGGMPVAPNRGILDLVRALEWVREEISAFGGSPERVTLFGESAGAMSTATLLAVPAARGLFQRAILESGAAHHVSGADRAEQVARTFLEELGLDTSEAARVEQVGVPALLEAQNRTTVRIARTIRGDAWQPNVDGTVLPEPPLEAVAKGSARGVELLIGTNADESKFWGINDPAGRAMDNSRLLRRLFRVLPGSLDERESRAREAARVYRKARSGRASTAAPELWFAIETDRVFRIPAVRLADAQRASAEVHMYLFTWPSPAMEGWPGACHTLEVPFVFGTVELPALRPFVGEGPEVERLSRRIQEAWLAFATEGTPRVREGPGWPSYEPRRRSVLRLDRDVEVLHSPLDAERRFWDGIL